MASTLTDVASGARTYLRDFPMFFEVDQGLLNTLTVRLPHPLVSASTLGVYTTDTSAATPVTTPTEAWSLDERNGLLKLTDVNLLNKRLLISGYHFSWFLDSDLAFHAGQVMSEMSYSGGAAIGDYAPAQVEVVMLGTIVNALWSLSMELMLDIDVSTPEGMMIPARQRYAQVTQMLGTFETQYHDKANMLGMGLGALQVMQLRRVALTTGRYVPVYTDREFDDPRWPQRQWPAIQDPVPHDQEPAYARYRRITGVLPVFTHGDTTPYDVEEIGHGSVDDIGQGWTSLGMRGDWP
jgi:hypothetical protein